MENKKKYLVVYLYKFFCKQLDRLISYLIVPAAYLLLLFRRIGSARLPSTSLRLKKIGVYPIIDHYYEPLFNDMQLSQSLKKDRKLPGIDLNDESQLELISSLHFSDELKLLNLSADTRSEQQFCISNGSFGSGDAEFLYQFIRKFKPSRIIEIGSGHSTKIARMALDRNYFDTGEVSTHICIEPYEQPWLENISGIRLIREKVEKINFNWRLELGDGDLLFVDSSHMIRPQGDVLFEYLEIFPTLSRGVFVHIHDIFTPKDYLESWVVNDVRFWNEQYLLEALLTNTNRYEVIAALNYLKHHYYEELLGVCPYLTEDREPGSFYFKVC